MLSPQWISFGPLALWVLLLSPYVDCAATSALCYDMDGTVMAGDRPCSPDSKVSQCCGLSWTCLENGMCATANTSTLTGQPADTLMRATCTDSSWESDTCPQFCLQPGNSKWRKRIAMLDRGAEQTFDSANWYIRASDPV